MAVAAAHPQLVHWPCADERARQEAAYRAVQDYLASLSRLQHAVPLPRNLSWQRPPEPGMPSNI